MSAALNAWGGGGGGVGARTKNTRTSTVPTVRQVVRPRVCKGNIQRPKRNVNYQKKRSAVYSQRVVGGGVAGAWRTTA